MSLYFFESNDSEQRYLVKHLPDELLHYRAARRPYVVARPSSS